MTILRIAILGTFAAVAAVPAAGVLNSSEPRAESAAHWVAAAYSRLAESLDLPSVSGDSPPSETSRPAAETDKATREVRSAASMDQPWDAPDWDEKVAAKILEKLVELPYEPPGTATLQSVPAAQTATKLAERQSAEQSWSNPPEAVIAPPPAAPISPPNADSGTPAYPEPVEAKVIEEEASRVASLAPMHDMIAASEATPPPEPSPPPQAETPAPAEEPRTEAVHKDEPAPFPPLQAETSTPAEESRTEAVEKDKKEEAPQVQVAGLPSVTGDPSGSEMAGSSNTEPMLVPIPPPRPEAPPIASTGAKKVSEKARARNEDNARRLAVSYLQSWSADNQEALSAMQRLSGQRIEYFGHPISRRAWLDKKRNFARDWPVRLYRHRPGSMSVECAGDTGRCLVRSTIDWETVSPSRGDFAAGVSQLELGIDFSGPQPKIHRESNLRIHARRNLPKVDPQVVDLPEVLEPERPMEAFAE